MNIVVVDAARLPAGAEFPLLKATKFRWEEFPRLADDQIGEKCLRADVIVTLGTSLSPTPISGLPRLKLVILGESGLVDVEAAKASGIEVHIVPSGKPSMCQEVADIIDDFIAASLQR
jgi:lactate dehydrogenase-like 2-hydroxyacid dehydrogenase